MGFMYFAIRSTNTERVQIITWLRRLHRNFPMFEFDTNALVFSTFAYGVVKAHQALGSMTPAQMDGVVKGVMSMADKLNKEDRGRPLPTTMPEVEAYLQERLPMDINEMLHLTAHIFNLLDPWSGQSSSTSPTQFLASCKLWLFRSYTWKVCDKALLPNGTSKYGAGAWWCIEKLHAAISLFHYSLCPDVLTFNGTLRLIISANPRMKLVLKDLSLEIFGVHDGSMKQDFMQVPQHHFDIEAHLPKMETDDLPALRTVTLYEDLLEWFICADYRKRLSKTISGRPQHLGIVMDGNRRYSREKRLRSVLSGHEVGAHKLLQVSTWAFSSGILNLTVWALSNDNLKRGPQELNPLFSMMDEYISQMMLGEASFTLPEIRFRVVGDRSILPENLQSTIAQAEAATARNTKFNLQVALGYGGRSEVIHATKLAINARTEQGVHAHDAVANLSETDVSRHIYSTQLGIPHIDAILRTSGENRLSGFALWESQHAEFCILKENWPALKQSSFLRAMLDLSRRNRRLGA